MSLISFAPLSVDGKYVYFEEHNIQRERSLKWNFCDNFCSNLCISIYNNTADKSLFFDGFGTFIDFPWLSLFIRLFHSHDGFNTLKPNLFQEQNWIPSFNGFHFTMIVHHVVEILIDTMFYKRLIKYLILQQFRVFLHDANVLFKNVLCGKLCRYF